MPDSSRPRFRDLAVFLIAFALLWTAFVIVVWKLALLPEQARPWFRTAVWCGAVLVWVRWQRPPKPLAWLGIAPISALAVATSAAVMVAIVVLNVLRVNLIGPSLERLAELSPGGYAWSLVGVFAEELVFRGVVQTRLMEEISAPFAVTLTALLFLAVHVPGWLLLAIPVSAGVVTTVFLIGVICGGLRTWTGSLWPAVAAHWANNLGALL